ncbi:hypothetical protein ASD38_02825 [Caulobacter sp. Root487D2Y]|jgi:hypothetical protein|uniref:DUF3606 domain-containing protein n=1 Tax=Caulobacter sp. Root487D2Y TaxID=1736547 RepID=UPI0006FAA942|nr:DUF3606 domain-containing protein [Caulobacter sp. Root487D2Y]KQY35507.1 hypothetical protein ASD38_02825 [Caulobacter sp. Root487D2Y]
MADNLQDRGPQDRARVNVNEPHEVSYWTRKFGVTPDQLRDAVTEVGVSADAVEQALKSRRGKA